MSAGLNSTLRAALIALACAGATLRPASAEATVRPTDVTISAEPDSLFAGERLRYLITVRHDRKDSVAVASLKTGQGTPFEITSTKSSSKILQNGSAVFRMDTEIAVFGSGQYQLPGFTVISGKGPVAAQARLDINPTASVTVLSMSDSTVTELRPISPPVSAPWPTWLLLPVLLLLAALGIVGYLVKLLVTALQRHFNDPVRAARIKLRSIRRQLSKGLPPADGYESLSNILREFLQKRYQFGAMEMVTQEIAEELASRKINIRHELLKLLDQADLVKFADRRPDIEECRRSLRIAEVLAATAAEPAPEEEEEKAGGEEG